MRKDIKNIKAVEVAKWLSDANILKDSVHRSGKPLRELFRWFIEKIK